MININNRRYIGNKTKLLDEIYGVVKESGYEKKNLVFADLFGGTGVVAYYFYQKGFNVIVNDTLYSNVIAYNAWFSNQKYDVQKIENEINYLNKLHYNSIPNNYFSKIYGKKYYSNNDAKKIGYIREYIEENKDKFNKREYFILLTSLMYVADKIANTVGHFEHYLKQEPTDSFFEMQMLNLGTFKNNCLIFNEDCNELAPKIKADIVYLDPPYNARQYVNFYHVLENLARWDKPTEFEGISMKFKRNHLKSGYSKSIAKKLMDQLIESIDAKLIIVSYNNTYNAKSGASNNKILEKDMEKILKKKGKVITKELNHRFFNSGKTNFNNHLEKLYICMVK